MIQTAPLPMVQACPSETVIRNDTSRFGLRRLHVLSSAGPDALERWLALVPPLAHHTLRVLSYGEPLLGIWHLEMDWHVREPVRLEFPDGEKKKAVMWRVDPGGRLSEALADAAGCYLAHFDQWPTQGLVSKLPQQAGRSIQLGEGTELPIEEAEWVPQRCVVVA